MASLGQVARESFKNTQRLSTGLAINSAADNASGLSITNLMTSQIRGLDVAGRNIRDGLALGATADGAMDQMVEMTQRMRELVIQSANGTMNDSDRVALDKEFQALKAQIGMVVEQTEWNGIGLLSAIARANELATPARISGPSPIDTSGPATGTYSLFINGHDVPVALNKDEGAALRLKRVVDAINQGTGTHGASARVNANGGVEVYTRDGSDLSVWYNSSLAGLSGAHFGLGTPAVAQVSTLTLSELANPYPTMTRTSEYVEFSGYGGSGEQISITQVNTPNVGNGQWSVVNGLVYRGNGTTAIPVGSVDAQRNGLNGQSLRINFKATFENGDFEQPVVNGQIPGWTTLNQRIVMNGGSTVAGWPTPNDATTPAPSLGETGIFSGGAFSSTIDTGNKSQGNQGLSMSTGGMTIDAFGLAHGPALVSKNPVAIQAGDSVSFDWKAQNGQDNFDVYAYLLNVADGSTVPLLNETGGVTNWATKTVTVPSSGAYKFVFIAGTFDATGGTAAGAQLYIDNVNVSGGSQYVPTANDASQLEAMVTYSDQTPFTLTATIAGTVITSDPSTSKNAAWASFKTKLDAQVSSGAIPSMQVVQQGDTLTLTSGTPGVSFSVTQVNSTSPFESLSAATVTASKTKIDVIDAIAGGNVNSTGARVVHGVKVTGQQLEDARSIWIQVGANANQKLAITLPNYGTPGGSIDALIWDTNATELSRALASAAGGLVTNGNGQAQLSIGSMTEAVATLSVLDQVMDDIAKDRVVLGAQLNRLTHAGDNVSTMDISQTASRSRILDSDYAKEASDMARLRIIQEAATSVLAQANVNQRSVLDLLK
ncbi:MAG: hypothetical protein RLZZ123_750 [Pseudomonadota bacterium]